MAGRVAATNRVNSAQVPTSLSTLVAWWRADACHLQNGGVDFLQDLSGNGFHLTQATAVKRPTVTASAVNSLPALTFDGANTFIQTSTNLTPTAGCHVFVVCAATSNQNSYVIDSNADVTKGITLQLVNTPANYWSVLTGAPDKLKARAYGTAYHAWEMSYDLTTINTYFDGTSELSTASVGTMTTGPMALGATFAGGNYFAGGIADVFIFNAVLSTGDRTAMKAYIANRYALTLA